ncbi:cation diffusion facilitator family transporter [Sphingomonas sp. ASV193]|uniref:cation diffusion facilitator family transporter n=1 Tax=Sphingomonas sp. ASV193 TaxID=3144405 RepID=UPI0032E8A210
MSGTGISHDHRSSLATRAAVASVTSAIVLIALKAIAASKTGSVAMLGSLADSGLDLMASLVTLAGVRIAAQPADREHRFGHGKAEALVAMVQVILIALSALAIFARSANRLAGGQQTQDAEFGIVVSLIAIVLTFGLTSYQRYVVRRTESVAISTDHAHYQSDLLLNGSVVLALALEQMLHLKGADALFGIGIALWLGWNAYGASKEAIGQLMDREWPDEERAAFLAAAADYPELEGLHDLRTRSSGTHRFVQFHAWVPGEWTVEHAHTVMDRVEEALQARFPNTEIIIHLDPEGHTDRETMLSSDLTETR